MIFDDSCRNYWVFSSVHLVGGWVDDDKVLALLASVLVPEHSYATGGLLCVYRFPADNIVIIIQSLPKERLGG